MAFDTRRNCVVLFGGQMLSGYPNTTWEYGYHATFTPFGMGCPGSAGTPDLTTCSPPVIGTNFCLTVNNVPLFSSVLNIIGTPLPVPFPLIILGAPNCNLYTNPVAIDSFDFIGGVWKKEYMIFRASGNLGALVRFQALVINPNLSVTVSNAGDAVFGTCYIQP